MTRPAIRIPEPYEGKIRFNSAGWQQYRDGRWLPYQPEQRGRAA